MNDLKKNFIDFALKNEILKFGDFTLKSGRKSPYYFNTGVCNNGFLINKLSSYYVDLINNQTLDFEFIFGPAYKGIPLATSISMQLFHEHNQIKPYSFNRKEIKKHGDGGIIAGHIKKGKAIVVDDVISSGSSIVESIELLKKHGSTCVGVFVALDRMEIGENTRASEEIQNLGIRVYSIITLSDIEECLSSNKSLNHHLDSMAEYISKYKR